MKKLIIVLLFITLAQGLNAQDNSRCINIEFQYRAEGVKIRWVYNDYISWKTAVKNGVSIQRAEFDENLRLINNTTLFDTLKPESLDEMKAKFGKDNMHAAVAAQMLYGKSRVTETENFGQFIKQKKNEQEMMHSTAMFVSALNFEVAKSIALGLEQQLEPDKNYVYKMFVRNTLCDTVYLSVSTHEYTEPTIVSNALQATPGEKKVILSWDGMQSDLIGYFIEKSPMNANDFVRLNEEPMVMIENEFNKEDLIYIDSLERNYVPYEYRLVGLNAFGDETQPSEAIIAMGRDVTPPPAPVISKIIAEPNAFLSIIWAQMPEVSDLKAFNVLRAAIIEGPYEQINDSPLSKENTSFNDLHPHALLPNFYVVEVVDTAGNSARSLPVQGVIIDTIAPGCPNAWLTDSVTNGSYTLVWNKSVEPDVMGYRVYSANAKDHVFTLVSDVVSDTSFQGKTTLKTLTEKIFFKVSAVDVHYNESRDCGIVELLRKDTIRPSNAVFKEVVTQSSAVLLSWIPSSSSDADSIFVVRKEAMDSTWTKVFEGSNHSDTLFSDVAIAKNTLYEYALFVTDKSKNQSPFSLPYRIAIAEQLALEAASQLQITSGETGKQLNWEGSLADKQSFIVYASADEGQTMTIIGRTNNNNLPLDERFSKEKYSFAVCLIDEQGKRSQLTNWVK
ncbi:MAG: hypothetical protein M0Q90_09515 [Bacteroidales bacterium]|nr:hypothetical protein [Bacteroidales bacterium]